jgi:hypothetical protein
MVVLLGGGRNVELQNYDWPFFSERRNCLFSLSLLRHHNVENGFWVDHYYDDQNIEKNIEIDFRCSDFTYGVKKGHNVENQNINYLWRITYGYQGLWGPGGLG